MSKSNSVLPLIEFLLACFLSFLGSIIFGFQAIGLSLGFYVPKGQGWYGDGFALITALFFITLPTWFLTLACTGLAYSGDYKLQKRLTVGVMLPIILVAIVSAVGSFTFFAITYN